jgi:hypothetical protein
MCNMSFKLMEDEFDEEIKNPNTDVAKLFVKIFMSSIKFAHHVEVNE